MELPSERLALVGVIDPQDAATTARNSAWVDMSKFHELLGVVLAGAVTGTIDAKFQQATTSAGAGAKDIPGRAITQMAATDDNKQKLISLRHDHMDIDGGFRYARLVLTPTGGTTNLAGAALLGCLARNTPVTNDDLSTVAEVV